MTIPSLPTDIIDEDIFRQIIELDDDGDGEHEFSRGMVEAFFAQSLLTFNQMDKALKAEELPKLSQLGHFLKGSAAALGVTRVQASCECLQHYGANRDEEEDVDLSNDEALKKIKPLLIQIKEEYAEAEQWLKDYYGIQRTAESETVDSEPPEPNDASSTKTDEADQSTPDPALPSVAETSS